jgi:hypothetical protein
MSDAYAARGISGIMPTTGLCRLRSALRWAGGGDRVLPHRPISIIRGVQETREVDLVGGTGLASHQAESCAPALAP